MKTIIRLSRRLVGAAALLVAAGLTTGCISNDKHLFTSLPHQPITVTVVETSTEAELWKYDVPVWHKLMLNFDTEGEASRDLMGGPGPTSMQWSLYGPKARDVFYDFMDSEPVEQDSVLLPGSLVAMKVTIREIEEQPINAPVPGPAEAPAAGPGNEMQPGEATEQVGDPRAQPDLDSALD